MAVNNTRLYNPYNYSRAHIFQAPERLHKHVRGLLIILSRPSIRANLSKCDSTARWGVGHTSLTSEGKGGPRDHLAGGGPTSETHPEGLLPRSTCFTHPLGLGFISSNYRDKNLSSKGSWRGWCPCLLGEWGSRRGGKGQWSLCSWAHGCHKQLRFNPNRNLQVVSPPNGKESWVLLLQILSVRVVHGSIDCQALWPPLSGGERKPLDQGSANISLQVKSSPHPVIYLLLIKSFIRTQPSPFIYILPLFASTPQGQSRVIVRKTVVKILKCLRAGLLQANFCWLLSIFFLAAPAACDSAPRRSSQARD